MARLLVVDYTEMTGRLIHILNVLEAVLRNTEAVL